jgi:rubrerythrin
MKKEKRMGILFSGNEIVDIAIKIEENGQAFYLAAAERAEDENLATVLRKLADDEVEHKATFEALYKSDEDYSLDAGYNEEVDAYIKSSRFWSWQWARRKTRFCTTLR